ncbi:MAG: VanZ family protein [Betaproteobacteria bacterium]|nr:MAG: VanZ family protein [Betaproteobacteria bacterium]
MRRAYIAVGWLLVAAIAWLSLTPSPPTIDVEQSDKAGHLFAYGLVMFWFAQLYAARAPRIAYAALFIAMGVGLEFMQRWLGYRTFEVFDMFADSAGVLLGWALALAFPKSLPRLSR